MGMRKCLQDLLYGSKYVVRVRKHEAIHLNAVYFHCTESSYEEHVPLGWYEDEFPKLTKLAQLFRNMDLVGRQLFDVSNNRTVSDKHLRRRMEHFKALSRVFLGSPNVQQEMMRNMNTGRAAKKFKPPVCFSKPHERDPLTINTLQQVANILNLSSQQSKVVRFTVCDQVTHHQVLSRTLEEILNGLKAEIESLRCAHLHKDTYMGLQIVSACLHFLDETVNCRDDNTCSWMRPKPMKAVDSASTRKWKELLEMFDDLVACLRGEEELGFYVLKLHVMREGLNQIKDVFVDKNIGYKEVRHMESLVQKKLSKTLGQSSRCLFTLLQYYLYGSVGDIEVEIGGGVYEVGRNQLCLCMGRILASDEEKMIRHGVKQLDRALGFFKFVWETAQMEGNLELQGHLWCVGAEHRKVMYRGNIYFVHGISL